MVEADVVERFVQRTGCVEAMGQLRRHSLIYTHMESAQMTVTVGECVGGIWF